MVHRRSSLALDERDRVRALDEVQRELFEQDLLAPLELGGADEHAWMDCELASLAENRLGDATHPDELTDARRAQWLARATTEGLWAPDHRSRLERLYWLRSQGHRVGTLALSAGSWHGPVVRASSLYVLPQHRRQGTASTLLRRLCEGLGEHGVALGLDTSWTWQAAVRTYMRLGAWVHMWKREISLRFDASLPAPIVELDGDRAMMAVRLDGERVELHRARREGERLVLEELPPSERPEVEELRWRSSSTFALVLALHGWPLLRSQEHWEQRRHADAGPPEALAYRIVQWEAWSRQQGWRVETPRIPGLRYPSWEELEAQWAREWAELERRGAERRGGGAGA